MRARTITTILVLGALAIPVSASAQPVDPPAGINSGLGPADSSRPAVDSDQSSVKPGVSDYSSLNSITPPPSESSSASGSSNASSGYASLNAITGPTEAPTFVSGPPSDTADGFDWASAGIGAGAAMALVALGGAALLTVRRRTAASPSAASTS
jgi:hypothetical protein